MNQKEKNMIEKMFFIEKNKEILKSNILSKIGEDSVVLLILSMLLDNQSLTNQEEYIKISKFIAEKQNESDFKYSNTIDLIGIIKIYVNKIYTGNEKNAIMTGLNECQSIFSKYVEEKQDFKLKVKGV